MNTKVADNFAKLKRSLFLLPVFFIITIILFLFSKDALSINGYIQVQKDCFYFMNYYLGQYPNIEYNITQIGDASVFLSFIILLIVYAPKIWETLITASLISLLFSFVLKRLFCVPRPAQIFDNNSFIIVGKKAVGFSSLPSGHALTMITVLTILMFGFMPKRQINKVLYKIIFLIIGLILISTRVGVGAHYPLDVVIGGLIGYICALIGIFISQKYSLWNFLCKINCYPIFMVIIIICSISLLFKINNENLIVYYLALISLFVSLYKFMHVYIKK